MQHEDEALQTPGLIEHSDTRIQNYKKKPHILTFLWCRASQYVALSECVGVYVKNVEGHLWAPMDFWPNSSPFFCDFRRQHQWTSGQILAHFL